MKGGNCSGKRTKAVRGHIEEVIESH